MPDSVYFRLPNEVEWTLAAEGNDADTKTRSKAPNIIITKEYFDSLNTGESMPAPVNAGYINKKGLINLRGNVSEMIMDSPYAFGGSFLDAMPDCGALSKSNLQPPQPNIGFRVVAVIRR